MPPKDGSMVETAAFSSFLSEVGRVKTTRVVVKDDKRHPIVGTQGVDPLFSLGLHPVEIGAVTHAVGIVEQHHNTLSSDRQPPRSKGCSTYTGA